MSSLLSQKAALRHTILAERRALPPQTRARYSQAICQKISALAEFQAAHAIAAFCSLPDEVDIWPLIDLALAQNKTIAVPRVANARQRLLSFHAVHHRSELQVGYASILEPPAAAPLQTHFDFILVPAVAVDSRNYRLGYGGGFYDFFLSQHPSVFTCIPAFMCQKVEKMPLESHDQSVKLLVTE